MQASENRPFQPQRATVKCVEAFREKYQSIKDIPDWVLQFDGPINEYGLEETCQQMLSDPFGLLWQRWARKSLKEGLGTMVLPTSLGLFHSVLKVSGFLLAVILLPSLPSLHGMDPTPGKV